MDNTNAVTVRDDAPVAVQSNAGSLLQAITQAASNPAVDIEKMERLFAMHQTMVRQEAETAFNAAMARAQAQMVAVVRDRANDFTKSTYATLTAINDAIVPIYTAEGFSISFDSGDCPVAGHIRTIAKVSHAAGYTREHHNDMPLDTAGSGGKVNKTAIQASGSTQSYARRYLVCQIFNVTTTDDNDGNKRTHSATDGAGQRVTPERRAFIQELSSRMKVNLTDGAVDDAVLLAENAGLDGADEWTFMWTYFDSKQRSSMKAAKAAMREKAQESSVITDAQRKRLEAMIAERGLDREAFKKMIYDDFAKEHFADLSPFEYDKVCHEVENSAAQQMPEGASQGAEGKAKDSPVFLEGITSAAAAEPIKSDVYHKLKDAYSNASAQLKGRFDLRVKDYGSIDALPIAKADLALSWLVSAIDKETAGQT